MKNNQDFSIKKPIIMLIALATLFIAAPLALAQNEARVYLQPVSNENGVMTVDVITENVTDMYGAEFRLKYDPAMVAVRDVNAEQEGIQIEAGTLLPADQGFVVANDTQEAEGTVTFAMTLLNPAPAATGSGPLARVSFNILQDGASVIDVEHAKLVSRDLQTIPSRTEAFEFVGEGAANNAENNDSATAATSATPAAGSTNFPWWLIAAAIMVLGALALGALILMNNSKPLQATAGATRKPQGGSPQPSRTSGTRPSAFKQQSFPPDAGQKPR